MKIIGIVVLNYLNYQDTFECIDSILKQTSKNTVITIVDNNSPNESFKELLFKYKSKKNIYVLKTESNLGYSRGNNVGINFLIEKFNIYNILICNNDVVFLDNNYIEKLISIRITKNIGAIGTEIIGSDGKNQNPQRLELSIKYFTTFILKAYIKKKLGFLFSKIKKFKMNNEQSIKIIKNENVSSGILSHNTVLHGSVLFLTENYLKEVKGFYPETFLYFEENILKIIMNKLDLKMYYVDYLKVYHKEDQSSAMSFNNDSEIKKKYSVHSAKIAIKVLLMNKRMLINEKFKYEQQI